MLLPNRIHRKLSDQKSLLLRRNRMTHPENPQSWKRNLIDDDYNRLWKKRKVLDGLPDNLFASLLTTASNIDTTPRDLFEAVLDPRLRRYSLKSELDDLKANTIVHHCLTVNVNDGIPLVIERRIAESGVENTSVNLVIQKNPFMELDFPSEESNIEKKMAQYLTKISKLEISREKVKSDLWKAHELFKEAENLWKSNMEKRIKEYERKADGDIQQLEIAALEAEKNFKRARKSESEVSKLKSQVLTLEASNALYKKVQNELTVDAVETELREAQFEEKARVLKSKLVSVNRELRNMTYIANEAKQRVARVIKVKARLIAQMSKRLESALVQSLTTDKQFADMTSLLTTAKQQAVKADDLKKQVEYLKEELGKSQKAMNEAKNTAELAEAALKLLREKSSATISELTVMQMLVKEKSKEVGQLQVKQVETESQLRHLMKTLSVVKGELVKKTHAASVAQEKVIAVSNERNEIESLWKENLDLAEVRFRKLESLIQKISVGLEAVSREALKSEALREQVGELILSFKKTKGSLRDIRQQSTKSLHEHQQNDRTASLELAVMKEKVLETEGELVHLRTRIVDVTSTEGKLKSELRRLNCVSASAQTQSAELNQRVQAKGSMCICVCQKIDH